MKRITRRSWERMILLLLLLAGACSYQTSPITGEKTPYGYSWQQELQIGRESDPAIVAEYGLYEDAELAEYVRQVGERVLAESHLRRPDTPEQYRIDFTFRILDSPVLNAFALPGGYVYVTRGLLAHMENEAQLAMVLGHEIGHVAARHASRQAFQSQMSQLGLVGGAIVGEVLAGAGAELLQVGSTATQLLLLSYSRGSETESDRLGVEYAAEAGYKAGEGAGFFVTLKRVSDKAGARIPSWQSTHPDPGEREVKIRSMAAEWDTKLEMTDLGRDRLLREIDGIVVGDNPRQGFERGNVFYHPDLAFLFPKPSGWTLYNLTTKVAMTDSEQQVVVILSLASSNSVEDAAASFASENSLNVLGNRATTINGLTARNVEASLTSNQQTLRVAAYFIEYGGRVYQFIGYTYASRFPQLETDIRKSALGFDELTDASILSIQPDRLQIITVQDEAPLGALIQDLPAPFEAADIAILNQLELSSQLEPGQQVKLITQSGE